MNRSTATTRPSLRTAVQRAGRFVLLASLCTASMAWAIPSVTFVATDLADTTLGEDLWQYDYSVSGPMQVFGQINIFFVQPSYASLTGLSNDATIDVLPTQPDTSLPADGYVTLTALSPLLAADQAHLGVSFVWKGTGAPGSQAFEVLDDQFNMIGGGITQAVPEPSSAALMLAGIGLALPLAARRRRTPR
ncbi:hypothetical protein BH11PSE8_BH11PSE8_37800 [soil metagenome]